MASEFIRCPGCGLFVSTRRSALCPRCARPVPGSTALAPTAPAAAPARPAPAPAPRAAASVAPGPAPAGAATRKDLSRLSPLGIVGSAVGAAIGIALSKVFGALLLFPSVFGAVAAVILVKAGPRRARPFVPAAIVLAGHAGWMTVGALMTGAWATVGIDVVLMLAGTAWLVARPGLAPAIALAIFEVLAGGANAWKLTTDLPEQAARALWLHLALRGLALAGLAFGYAGFRRARAGAAREALAQTFE